MFYQKSFISLLSLALALSVFPIAQQARANELTLNNSQISRLGIKLEAVRTAKQETIAIIPGTIIPSMNGRTGLVAPFGGTVVSVSVLAGQTVQKGELLMTVASREILEAQSNLKQAEAELDNAKAVAYRHRTLANKKIGANSRALEAEAQVAFARAKVSSLKRILELGSIRLNSDGSYDLVAAKSGRIVATKASPGASIDAMAPAVIIDTSYVMWVEAQLPASYVSEIHQGDVIEARSVDGKRVASGRVLSVGHSLDPMSRSTKLTGELTNGLKFLSGEFVNVSIIRAAKLGGLEVPSASVAFIEGKSNIFVRTQKGFSVAAVKVRGKSFKLATIEGEVLPGQQVATSGLAILENMIAGE